MSLKKNLKAIFKVLTLFISLNAYADGTVSYGDLFIADSASVSHKNRVQASYGNSVSNPFLNIKSTGLSYYRELYPILDLGLQAELLSSETTKYNQTLERELQIFGVQANHDRPVAGIFLSSRLKVLSGRVNLLGSGALPFQFNLKLGQGFNWFERRGRQALTLWGLENELMATPSLGFGLAFEQSVENILGGGETIYRNRFVINTTAHF